MKRHTSGLCRLIFVKRKSIDDEEVRHARKSPDNVPGFQSMPPYRARHFLQFAYWR
jgi:hypothetical protein